MAFVEQDRVIIRYYLGWGALWLQADPRLEAAISNIQAVQTMQGATAFGYNPGTVTPDPNAVGGTRPDSSSENQVRLLVQKLEGVDARLEALDDMMGAGRIDDASFDPVREDARLRRRGRMFVFRLAKLLDTEPRADVFATSSDAVGGDFRAGSAYPASGFAARVRRAY